MAEFLLRHRVEPLGIDWSISSAGTHAIGGHPMHRHTARLLHDRGITVPDSWRTRPVDRDLLLDSDLILTATRQQRSMLVERAPDSLAKTFTILQFARYAESTRDMGAWDPHRQDGRQLLQSLNRSEVSQRPEDDDLADPVGRWYRPFKVCALLLDRAFDGILGERDNRPVTSPTGR